MSEKPNPVSEAPQTPQPEEVVRKKPFVKKLVIGLVVLVLLVVVVVLAIPTMLSTNPGKNFILGYANDSIAGKIEADSISLGWFSGQSVTGLRVLDPDGKTVVTVAKIDMPSVRLLKLTDLSNDLGTITIEQPKVDIIKQGDTTNLQAAIAAKSASSGSSGKSGSSSSSATKIQGPRGVIDIKGLAVTATGFAPEVVSMNVQTFTVDAKDLGMLGLKLAGDAMYGKDKGLFGADLSVQGLVTSAGALEPQNAKVIGTVDVRKLPLAAIDAVVGTQGALVAILGPELNIEVKTNISQEAGTASVGVTTQNLSVNVPLIKQGNSILMDKAGAKVSLNILKGPANEQMAKRQAPVTLERDIKLELIVTSLALPIVPAKSADEGPSVDYKKLRLDASLTASDVLLDIKSNDIGKFEWKGTRADISIPEELDKQATVTLRGGSATTGGVNALASVKNLSNNPTFTLNADIDNVPVDVVDTLAKQDGKLVALLGSKLELIQIKGERDPDGKGGVRLVIKSTNLNGELAANIAPDAVTLDDKSASNKMSLVLSPGAFAKFQGEAADINLKQPLTLDLLVKKFVLPMADNSPVTDKLATSVDLTLGDIAAEIPGKPAITWAKTTIAVTTPALAQSVNVTAVGGSAKTGKLSAKADITSPLAETRVVNASGELTQFPVSLADAFAAQEGKLVALLGNTISSANFQVAIAPSTPITAGLDLVSDQATASIKATVDMDRGAASLNKNDYITLRLTPAAVEKFMPADTTKPQRFELSEPVDVRVDVANLKVGWNQPRLAQAAADKPAANAATASDASAGGAAGMSLDPARTSIDLAITTKGGAVKMTRTGEVLKLGEGKTTITSNDPSKEILVKSATALQTVSSTSKIPAGDFKVENLSVKNLQYEGFAPVLKNFDVDARLTGTNVPMELVDTYMNKQGEYVKLLGSDLDVSAGLSNFHLDGTAVPEMTGPLDLKIVTRLAGKQVATLFSKGDLKNGILKYTEDGPITFNVTPEFSRQFLEKVSPLIQAVGGQKPISATPTKGFEVPVSGFDMKKVLGTINLDLGTLNLQQGGLLARVIGLVGKFDSNVQKMVDTDYAVSFTPTSLNLKGGKLNYSGMAMKTGPVSMTYDANVDLVTNMLDPGTRVNIKGETFAGIKAISPYIKPEDTIRISLSGPITSPKIDMADAGKQLAEIAGKGKLGEIIDSKVGPGVGNLLDALGGKKEQPPADQPKEGEKQPEQKKEDPLGGLLNTGFNLLEKKTQPKQNPPATQPAK